MNGGGWYNCESALVKDAEAGPEKWKQRWLKWCAEGAARNFQLIKYLLEHFNCFASIHVVLHLSVFYHHHEEPCLSDWFASHHTLGLQEWFTRMFCSSKSESAQRKNIMDTAYPRGVTSHPLDQPLGWGMNGKSNFGNDINKSMTSSPKQDVDPKPNPPHARTRGGCRAAYLKLQPTSTLQSQYN